MAAATGKVKIGKDSLVYYCTTVTGALADRTWVLYGKVQEVQRKSAHGSIEVVEYDSDFVKHLRGHRDESLSLKVTRRPGHTGFDALQTAYEAGNVVGLALVTHGASIEEEGARVWWGDVELHEWSEDTSKDGTTCDIVPKLTPNSAYEPESVTIA